MTLRGGATLETVRAGRGDAQGNGDERSNPTAIEPRDHHQNDLIGYYHRTDMRMRVRESPL